MGFLRELLGRPENEKPVMLIVTGYPAPDARVPLLSRKPLEEIATFR
jgi:iodotyrosine deiodinase